MTIPGLASEITHFIFPEGSPCLGHLGRYLSSPAANVLDAYCEAYAPPGGVVLDPFARSDAVARAAGRTGRRAILAESNSLAAFIARSSMLPVTGQDFGRALAKISGNKVGEIELGAYLDALYRTPCPRCGAPAVATELHWDEALGVPVAKRCQCPACHLGESGTVELSPTVSEDLEAARVVDPRGPHFASLVRRVCGERAEETGLATELIDLYPPRAALALYTLLDRIEAARFGPNLEQVLKLCLLEALSACSRLATEPTTCRSEEIVLRPRPKWVERNAWRVFAKACEDTKRRLEQRGGDQSAPRPAASVERVLDPNAYGRLGSPPNAIVLQVAARQLRQALPEGTVDLVLCEPPGPADGLFLCLSYLWAGWLLGDGATTGLEQVPCTSRPMDWAAYFRAIGASVHGLLPLLSASGRMVFCFSAYQHRQFEMLLLAPLAAGMALRRALASPGQQSETRYVLEFGRASAAEQEVLRSALELGARRLDIALRHEVDDATRELLRLRAEPTEYSWLYVAAMERLGRTGLLAAMLAEHDYAAERVADLVHRETAEALERGTRKGYLWRQDLPRLTWALARPPQDAIALCDRVELAVCSHLNTHRTTTAANVRRLVHALFPGLATPPDGWIDECLASYGRRTRGEGWCLAAEERLASRVEDHTQAVGLLTELGHRFGFRVWIGREEQKRPYGGSTLGHLLSVAERYASPANLVGETEGADVDVIWYDGGASLWLFEVEWSAAFSQAVAGRRLPAQGRRFLVVADERVGLVSRKLERFPWLGPQLEHDGWQFLTWSRLAEFATTEGVHAADLPAFAGLGEWTQARGSKGR